MHHVRVTYYTSSGAQTHQHETFDLLVTPFILNSKTSPSSSTWHAHIARVLGVSGRSLFFFLTAGAPRR